MHKVIKLFCIEITPNLPILTQTKNTTRMRVSLFIRRYPALPTPYTHLFKLNFELSVTVQWIQYITGLFTKN